MLIAISKVLIIINFYLIQNTVEDKIILYDSTKYKDDLNWLKLSYIDNSSTEKGLNEIDFQNSIINSNDNLYGWKESSYSSANGDDLWRIYFVCDLSVKNIQNWLFTPFVELKQINRLLINLTYTIRSCEQQQQQQSSRKSSCKEKFDLYYEEINENEYYEQLAYNAADTGIIDIDKSIGLLNRIKTFRYHETFLPGKLSPGSSRNKNGDYITNQIADFPFGTNNATTTPTYIRFAIRDTGSCVSLLGVELAYVVCPRLVKHGVVFPETSTGTYLTDFVYVSGNCPLNSISTQTPKALCTAKGEWLITDQNLANNCLCLPGYEFKGDICMPCKPGTFKRSTSNQQQCQPCPSNSWSYTHGAEKCDCFKKFARDNDYNVTSDCKELFEFDANNLNIDLLNINNDIGVQATGSNHTIVCWQCDVARMSCTMPCHSQQQKTNILLLANVDNDKQVYRLNIAERQVLANMNNTVLDLRLNKISNKMDFHDSLIQIKKPTCNTNADTVCYNITIYISPVVNVTSPYTRANNRIYRLKIYSLDRTSNDYKLMKTLNMTKQQHHRSTKHLTILHCNYDKAIKSLKVQVDFVDQKQFDVYFYDVNVGGPCDGTAKNAPKVDYASDTLRTDELNTDKTHRPPPQQLDSNRFNIILSVLLTSILLTFLVFIVLIAKRLYNNSKTKLFDKNCKFENLFPIMNQSTSCSQHSSTAESTTESTHSTTLTHMLSLQNNSKLYYLDPHTYEDPCLTIQNFTNEISPSDIHIDSVIGGGEFGDVCKGKLRMNTTNKWLTVAIKTLKPNSSEKSRCDFLTEASIMSQFHHENIIYLEGVVTKSTPYMILTEYIDNGSLDAFLRLNSWRLNIENLVDILKDVACGMRYLADLNFVHRDLAARNILITKDFRCKVADFGLSRELEVDETEGTYWTKGGKIPIRWTAPEAISFRKFTSSSDVWSYGILCWEVMSYGARPYWNWSNQDVIKSIDKGFRLPSPSGCPIVIYEIMFKCWNMDRLLRPKFNDLVGNLDIIISKKDLLYSFLSPQQQTTYIDSNRPNIAQLTSIDDWLNSLSLAQYCIQFKHSNYLSLSQILNLNSNDLLSAGVFSQTHQIIMLQSLNNIKQDISQQNGCLV